MSNSIGIGVLGCGRIGVMHAELIAQRIEGAHLAGVYDVVAESAKQIATKFNCKHFESPDALMSAPEVGAIAICTSTDTHVEVLLMASKYRKPVFCEKPISLSLSETDKALKAISETEKIDDQLIWQIDHLRRFRNDLVHNMKDISSGAVLDYMQSLRQVKQELKKLK